MLLKSSFSNDFEHIIKKKFIKIKNLIEMLSQYAPSRLTGTGSCVFSQFNNKKSAQKILSLIPKNMKGFIAKSIDISPDHQFLKNKIISLREM
ncbi:hypothetical protein [Buchnera aphidicola]|uniref:hypothetical protein n=1 Tax=Buchnera aphidicola TaxID=9 RepID=UPI0021C57313|nr:hypothetical protein [Buchnera aphidicola]